MKHINVKNLLRHLVFCVGTAVRLQAISDLPVNETPFSQQEAQKVQEPESMLSLVAPSYEHKKFLGLIMPFKFALMGYIKNEGFFDTHRVIGLRQDHFASFPQRQQPDRCGRDSAAKGAFNMLTIETRTRLEIAGPHVFGIPVYSAIEFDFWGFSFKFLGYLRMRHGFIYFHWPQKSLLLGLYWHPITIPECYPNTVSANGGMPIEGAGRDPQVRFTKYFDNITIILAAIARVNSLAFGPIEATPQAPFFDSRFTRNAIMPNLHIQAHATLGNQIIGIGADVTRFFPRLVTNYDYKAKDSFCSWLALAFTTIRWDNVLFKTKFIFSQNGAGYGLISGYAVHAINPFNDQREYTNTQAVSIWADLEYKAPLEPGIFIGYTKNIGSPKTLITQVTSDGIIEPTIYIPNASALDFVFRVAPRIRWFNGPFVVGAELDYSRAAFGSINNFGTIYDKRPVNNVRFLFATYYYF